MKPNGLAPECPRGHAPGSSPDRRLVAVGLVLIGVPFLLGAGGSLMVADEAIGPLVTFALWLALFIYRAIRSRGGIYFIEWIAVVGSLVMLQLLLDLHTRYLGDIVIVILHVTFLIVALIATWRSRRNEQRAHTP